MVFDPDRNCAGAELIGGTDDMPAERPLRAILRAANDQFRLDLYFD